MNMHYHFRDESMTEDIANDKGKIVRYVDVHSIGHTEEEARIKSNLDDKYALIHIHLLGDDWN